MTTFLNDTFTDTNGVNLNAHTGETGATWTKTPTYTNNALIQTNRIYGSANNASYYASGAPATADYEVTATVNIVSAANVETAVAGRVSSSADTMYFLQIQRTSPGGGTWAVKLFSAVAGTYAQLGSTFTPTTPSVGSDHTLKVRMVGNQISGYYDDVLQIGPITNTAVTAAGNAGVRFGIAGTSTTGFHIADITAVDIYPGKFTGINQAVKRAAYY